MSKSIKLSFFLLSRFQYLERAHQRFIDTHNGSRVIKLSAVIRRAKYRYKLSLCEKFIALLNYLVRPANQVDVLFFQKIWNYIWPKNKTDPSLVLVPSLNAFLRVRPKQIAQKPLIRHFDWPYYFQDLLKALKLGTEPSMHTHNFLIDQSTYRHDIEDIWKEFPKFKIVFSFT